jgi:hypothetical protein
MKRTGYLFVLLVGCGGGSDANVEGDFTIALTNRDNGCNFANWTVGDTAANIPVVIAQTESNVQATVNGGAGLALDLAFGARTYSGTVDGNDLLLELQGSRAQSMGNCAFTYNSQIDARIDVDTLTGRIDYTTATNGNTDCAPIDGCVSFQEFNGTRPPT